MRKLYRLSNSENVVNIVTNDIEHAEILHAEVWVDLDMAVDLAKLVIKKQVYDNMYADNVILTCSFDEITKEELLGDGVIYLRAYDPTGKDKKHCKDYYMNIREEKNFFLRLLATLFNHRCNGIEVIRNEKVK